MTAKVSSTYLWEADRQPTRWEKRMRDMEEGKWGRGDGMRYSQRWMHPFIPFQQSLNWEDITWWPDRTVNMKRITRACWKLEDSGNGTFDIFLNLLVTVNCVKPRRNFKVGKVVLSLVVHEQKVPDLYAGLTSHKTRKSIGRRKSPFKWMRTKHTSKRRTRWQLHNGLLVSALPRSPYFWI